MPDLNRLLPATPKGWQYELICKPIRHIYFRIYPDRKTVRISAPSRISNKVLKQACEAKSAWLIQKLTALDNTDNTVQPVCPLPVMRDSRSCVVWGQRLCVQYKDFSGRPGIRFDPPSGIIVRVPLGFDEKRQENLWNQWLRKLLTERIQILLEKWQPRMGVAPAQCRLKKMKTRWGSCNTVAKRVWINAVLVHLEPDLLEYVLVHELTHLLESGHTRRFYQILQTHLPDWKAREEQLDMITPGL